MEPLEAPGTPTPPNDFGELHDLVSAWIEAEVQATSTEAVNRPSPSISDFEHATGIVRGRTVEFVEVLTKAYRKAGIPWPQNTPAWKRRLGPDVLNTYTRVCHVLQLLADLRDLERSPQRPPLEDHDQWRAIASNRLAASTRDGDTVEVAARAEVSRYLEEAQQALTHQGLEGSVAVLEDRVTDLLELLAQKDATIAQKDATTAQLQQEIAQLQQLLYREYDPAGTRKA
ncbi:MAG: hypothetical protein GY882_13030 [Actinomycetia bacterium]|nr:hypothetical protein [Actinomycetes bacterium]